MLQFVDFIFPGHRAQFRSAENMSRGANRDIRHKLTSDRNSEDVTVIMRESQRGEYQGMRLDK